MSSRFLSGLMLAAVVAAALAAVLGVRDVLRADEVRAGQVFVDVVVPVVFGAYFAWRARTYARAGRER